jgi:hypothetical protein
MLSEHSTFKSTFSKIFKIYPPPGTFQKRKVKNLPICNNLQLVSRCVDPPLPHLYLPI